jgi:hypothetical protein
LRAKILALVVSRVQLKQKRKREREEYVTLKVLMPNTRRSILLILNVGCLNTSVRSGKRRIGDSLRVAHRDLLWLAKKQREISIRVQALPTRMCLRRATSVQTSVGVKGDEPVREIYNTVFFKILAHRNIYIYCSFLFYFIAKN